MAGAHGFVVGQTVAVANVAVAAYNGSWVVTAVPDTTHFQYVLPGETNLAPSGGGTAQIAGNISPGVHQITVLFQTRQGYITAPAPPGQWTSAGGNRVVVSNIPTGPSNVVARIVAFTGAGGANFYFVPSTMTIADNVTTSLTVDFSDAILLAAQNVDQQFNLLELGECAGVMGYSSRLFWWGERNKQTNWVNLTFDGGFDPSGNGRPLGWQRNVINGAGSQQESTDVVWGNAYRIVADGSTPLHQAVQEEHVGMIRALAAAGGKLDAVNKDNLTPLLLAEKPKKPDPLDMGDLDAYKPKRNSKEEVIAALRELMHLGPNDPAPQPPPLPATDKKDDKKVTDDKEQKKTTAAAAVPSAQ